MYYKISIFAIFLITHHHAIGYGSRSVDENDRLCQPLTIQECRRIGYNYTRLPAYPNGPLDQESAASILNEFRPLINTRCSEHLTFLLCSSLVPLCSPHVDYAITSCRNVCVDVKKSCSPWMQRAKHNWPEFLNCTRFPMPASQILCMRPGNDDSD